MLEVVCFTQVCLRGRLYHATRIFKESHNQWIGFGAYGSLKPLEP